MGVGSELGSTERQRFWPNHVRQCERGSMSSSVYAKAHGLSMTLWYNARKVLRENGALSSQRSKGSRFARVTVAPAAPLSKQAVCRAHLLNGCTVDECVRVRQLECRPMLEQFREWLDQIRLTVPPKSALNQAMAYLDQQWSRLFVYLDTGEAEMTNNRAERAIRPFVIGCRAWLFGNSVNGVQASDNPNSLVENARANDVEAYACLRHVFEELPKATIVDDAEALLPYNVDPADLAQAVH